jgi:hypothetical protein
LLSRKAQLPLMTEILSCIIEEMMASRGFKDSSLGLNIVPT